MEQRRTEQAYWEDTYRFRDTAHVVQVAEHPPPRGSASGASYFAVVLDRTIFHPQGGIYSF
jgi:Ser-tRNA(Ala) deacylase AlaX